jgi:hypothetical protein
MANIFEYFQGLRAASISQGTIVLCLWAAAYRRDFPT